MGEVIMLNKNKVVNHIEVRRKALASLMSTFVDSAAAIQGVAIIAQLTDGTFECGWTPTQSGDALEYVEALERDMFNEAGPRDLVDQLGTPDPEYDVLVDEVEEVGLKDDD